MAYYMTRFDNILLKKKTSFESTNKMEVIFAAIAASPLRDIQTARLAYNCNTAEAVHHCLQSCDKRELRRTALIHVDFIISCTSASFFYNILEGVRLGMTAFSADWHPTILSWFQVLILEKALDHCICSGITDISEWNLILERYTHSFISYLTKYPQLKEVSNY